MPAVTTRTRRTPPEEGDDSNPYKGWLKADWEAELNRRNGERAEDNQIVPEGPKATDLKAAILKDDEARNAG